jgi:methyl-accepting chemotaxis protein/hemerythrin
MITWKNDYSVKYDGIDEQHKKLISIIQEVEAEINSQEYHFTGLITVVNELDDYIKEHLAYEEAMMKKLKNLLKVPPNVENVIQCVIM